MGNTWFLKIEHAVCGLNATVYAGHFYYTDTGVTLRQCLQCTCLECTNQTTSKLSSTLNRTEGIGYL